MYASMEHMTKPAYTDGGQLGLPVEDDDGSPWEGAMSDPPGGSSDFLFPTQPSLSQDAMGRTPSSAPSWRDSVHKAWLGLHELHPARTDFTMDEICIYTDTHWDTIRGTNEKNNGWKAGIRRICTTTDVLAKSPRPDAPPHAYVLGVQRKSSGPAKSGHRGIKGSRKRDSGDLAGSSGDDDPHLSYSRRIARRTSGIDKDVAEASKTGNGPSQAEGKNAAYDAVGRAAIPSEWIEVPPGPVLSDLDRAPALTFVDGPDSRMVVRGFKGYRMVRATHGVCEGDWFFEATVMPYEGDGAVRLGWSTRRSDTETPAGFDSQSFGIRDRSGEFVHKAQLRKYGKPFGIGDVVGCRLKLPYISDDMKKSIVDSDHRWLEHRFLNYLQGKAPPDTGIFHEGASVEYFKNGETFGVPEQMIPLSEASSSQNANLEFQPARIVVPVGLYFPSISLYRNSVVSVNFGPDFKYPIPDGCKPISESLKDMEIASSSLPVNKSEESPLSPRNDLTATDPGLGATQNELPSSDTAPIAPDSGEVKLKCHREQIISNTLDITTYSLEDAGAVLSDTSSESDGSAPEPVMPEADVIDL